MYALFLLVLVFVLLAIDPPAMLMVIGIIYVGSGLVITLLGLRQWKARRLKRTQPDGAKVKAETPSDPPSKSEQDKADS